MTASQAKRIIDVQEASISRALEHIGEVEDSLGEIESPTKAQERELNRASQIRFEGRPLHDRINETR